MQPDNERLIRRLKQGKRACEILSMIAFEASGESDGGWFDTADMIQDEIERLENATS